MNERASTHHRVTLLAWACLLPAGSGFADTFLLHSGGQIRGQWLNRVENPPYYVVRTESGGQITLPRAEVRKTIHEPSALAEYERIAPTVPDTIEAQWKLAEWCRERQLKDERAVHLRRIVALDPDHAEARRALGYGQIRGQWMLREEFLRKEGLELHNGRWMTRQEIEIDESRRKALAVEKEWLAKLQRWRADLDTSRAPAAQAGIAAIRDPLAIRALLSMIQSEPQRPVKLLYIETLGQIRESAAKVALVHLSLNDPDEEIFHACLDQIVKKQTPETVEFYTRTLKDNNNVRLNRAAIALARFGDRSAVPPLIDALISTHTAVQAGSGQPGAMTTTFARPAGAAPGNDATGMSTGGGPQVTRIRVPNQQVLNSLVRLSGGVSHGFNQAAWHSWYEMEKAKPPVVNARRD